MLRASKKSGNTPCGKDGASLHPSRQDGTRMLDAIVALCDALPQFARREKPMTKRLPYLTALLCLFAIPLRGSPMGAEVQGSHYDAAKQIVTFDLLNTSHKDITAYALLVRVIRSDGTPAVWTYGGDFVPFMSQNGGNGALKPGATVAVDVPLGQQKIESASATVNVVVYEDNTADVLNEQIFQSIAEGRKAWMLGLQEANQLLQSALGDASDPHPSNTVLAKLTALAKTRPSSVGLMDAATNIANAPKSPAGRSDKEDNYLRTLIKAHQDRIAIISAHTRLTKGVQP